MAQLLIDLEQPVALGVLYRQAADSFEKLFHEHHASNMRRTASVAEALRRTNTWSIG